VSQGGTGWLLAVTVIVPLASAVIVAALGRIERALRTVAVLYALVMAALGTATLNRFLVQGHRLAWGSLAAGAFNLPFFFMLAMVSAAAALYTALRRPRTAGPWTVAALMAASGLGELALLAGGLLSYVLLWEGVTAAALAGLAAQGRAGLSGRIRAFLPWLAADLLLVFGAVLEKVWLRESAVLIRPPLTSGTETQVVVVMVLFLLSALVRLGIFPFHFWQRDLISRADPSWSALFMGGVNPLLAGARVILVSVMVARLVAADWSLALALIGLVSIAVGAAIALGADKITEYLAGLIAFQGGFLLAGAGLFTRSGIDGALFCALVAPLFTTAAIMAAGMTVELTGSHELGRRVLPARTAPAALGVLLLAGISFAGLPPTDGFVGKAYVVLSGIDRGMASHVYTLTAAIQLAAVAVAAAAVVKMIGGLFSFEPAAAIPGKPLALEAAAPIGLCGASFLIGVFPGVLLRNFIRSASRLLYPAGFSGPGVNFQATGTSVDRALSHYLSWSETAAAFLVAVAVLALVLYFANRRLRGSAPLAESEEKKA
jgi:formate hydrogenlyase subunit 3/multisubunit Na+/H+ antiporter MnhD subunit